MLAKVKTFFLSESEKSAVSKTLSKEAGKRGKSETDSDSLDLSLEEMDEIFGGLCEFGEGDDSGHVFVVFSDLRKIQCDLWLVTFSFPFFPFLFPFPFHFPFPFPSPSRCVIHFVLYEQRLRVLTSPRLLSVGALWLQLLCWSQVVGLYPPNYPRLLPGFRLSPQHLLRLDGDRDQGFVCGDSSHLFPVVFLAFRLVSPSQKDEVTPSLPPRRMFF
jgi:hypothetical protein